MHPARKHAVDRRFDEFAVVGLLHVIGAHHFKYVAEQVELPVWVGGGRFRACSDEDAVWLRRQECEPGTCDRAQENEKILRIIRELFTVVYCPPKGAGINGEPSCRTHTVAAAADTCHPPLRGSPVTRTGRDRRKSSHSCNKTRYPTPPFGCAPNPPYPWRTTYAGGRAKNLAFFAPRPRNRIRISG